MNDTNSELYIGGYDTSKLALGATSEGYGFHYYPLVGDYKTWTIEL